ncbi:HTH La-type RNA-binding domain-containing protein [Madurella fahalii]|uniref:HTH La-type RNA-binding domain-containing protein n=1 Tax=Madurella fahalii TaxID=1157608 RepID=A0ABQ0G0E8_9PEZI
MSTTTFSYAQAARGRAVSQPSPQQESSPAPSTAGSQTKDEASTGNTSVTAPSVASNGAETRDKDHSIEADAEDGLPRQDSEVASVGGSASSTASAVEQSGKTTREGSATPADAQSHAEEKGSRSTSRTSRFNDSVDGRKARKGKKGRASDKDAQSEQNQDEDVEKAKEATKPVVLTEAVPPAVNPWIKRIEAQKAAAKAKVASASDSSAAGNVLKQGTPQGEAGAHSAAPNGVNGDKWSQKKPAEVSRPTDQAPRRSVPRGSRANDKDERSPVSLPLATDPSSWPDPKSAAALEQPTRKTQEKTDVGEKEGQEDSGPTRKKTWEKLEISHSVVFETPLPVRGSKPRGGARGGREAGPMRGSQPSAANATTAPASNTVNDKAAAMGGSMVHKTATNRPREGSIPARAASQTQTSYPSKRASIDGASRDQRKPSVTGNTDQARDTNFDASSSSKRASATRDIRTENGPLGSEGGQPSARTFTQERTNSFQTKDGGHGAVNGQQYPTRDGRPERGRGGGYRARGGHNGSHSASASYGPNGHYAAPGSFSSRSNPNAHSPPLFPGQFPTSFGHASRGRGNKWAGSGQSTGRSNPGATGFPPKVTPVNDFGVAQYPPYMYSPVFDPSVSILKAQVEYYFSVENLCKDYYLRQHMDGQGFAHLSTITGFKRIKAITEDLELIRLACSLSDQIEFGVGDDGIERLRIREKWNHFVLPVEDRLEPYRNDGPASWTPCVRADAPFASYPGPLVPQPAGAFPGFSEQIFQPPFVNGAHYDPTVNGGAVNGHRFGQETRLSAGVPEYAPPESPVTLESMTNFSDAQVENLMMILSYGEKDGASSPGAAGVAGYVSENPNRDQNGGGSNSAEAQSTDGEAANASVHAQPLGQTDQSGPGVVWVDEEASSGSTKAQTDRRAYTEIRKIALEQRQSAGPGETPKEMQKLYEFWSRMLLKDFNAKVYQEFRTLALEDASRDVPLRSGLKYLLEFYDALLLKTDTRKPWPSDRAVPEIFTTHFNEAADLDRKYGAKDVTTN